MLKIYLILMGFIVFGTKVFASDTQNARPRGGSYSSELSITHRNIQDSLIFWKHELSVRLPAEVTHCIIHNKDLSPIVSQLQSYIKIAHSCQNNPLDGISDEQKQELIKLTQQLESRYSRIFGIMARRKQTGSKV